MCLRVNEVQSL